VSISIFTFLSHFFAGRCWCSFRAKISGLLVGSGADGAVWIYPFEWHDRQTFPQQTCRSAILLSIVTIVTATQTCSTLYCHRIVLLVVFALRVRFINPYRTNRYTLLQNVLGNIRFFRHVLEPVLDQANINREDRPFV
jgi:hypothetical protein